MEFRLISRWGSPGAREPFEVRWEESRNYVGQFTSDIFNTKPGANMHMLDRLTNILACVDLLDDLEINRHFAQAAKQFGNKDFEVFVTARGWHQDTEYVMFNPPQQAWVDRNLCLVFQHHDRYRKKKVDLLSLIPF